MISHDQICKSNFFGKIMQEEEREDFSGGQITSNKQSTDVDFAVVVSGGVDSAEVDFA